MTLTTTVLSLKDLLVLEEAIADLVDLFFKNQQKRKGKFRDLALHLDLDGPSNNRFRLVLEGELPADKLTTVARTNLRPIPSGISECDLNLFFRSRISQILSTNGWTRTRERPDTHDFLTRYARA